MATDLIENPISATLDFLDVSRQLWDVVIVGAGPTGSLAARQLSQQGVSVLFVDRMSFPRGKVCGCCLNGRAVALLRQTGLLQEVQAAGAVSLSEFELWAGGQTLNLSLPDSLSLSRSQLDALLVRSAINNGAAFLPETEAHLGSFTGDTREIILTQQTKSISIQGKIVLVCEGLNQRLLKRAEEFSCTIDERSSIGVGAATTQITQEIIQPGTIYMAVGKSGYVGAVLVEDSSLNIAAALNLDSLKQGESIGTVIQQILQEAGCTLPVDVNRLRWQGTPKLTRQTTPVAARRLLVLGDAAGYVEPFTGEGMGWGFASAIASISVVLAGLERWDETIEKKWIRHHQQQIHKQQKWCRRCASVLKRPDLVKTLIKVIKFCPLIVSPIINHINKP